LCRSHCPADSLGCGFWSVGWVCYRASRPLYAVGIVVCPEQLVFHVCTPVGCDLWVDVEWARKSVFEVCQNIDRCGVPIRVLHFRVETRAREMLHTVPGNGWWYGASFGLSLRVVLKIASDKVLGRVLFFSMTWASQQTVWKW